ncbi:hypothetical protein VTJ49DRAFT_7213 [Mycothermus thermophilus]|uniref:Enoyl-CoA hydratase domain-containing protein 3, mitochondrial n=1 Tax=Humicola insolens TaxID=85995 RepID=A0ABR3VQ27_HUMIN
MALPVLPRGAAYIMLNAPARRNALSLSELRSLRDQLIKANTSPTTGRLLLLPPFKPSVLASLEQAHSRLSASSGPSPPKASPKLNLDANHTGTPSHQPPGQQQQQQEAAEEEDYTWLTSPMHFSHTRSTLPRVLVLASSPGPVFSSGHDLGELRTASSSQISETFRLCAEVMTLLRRSPQLIVGRIAGHAIAAGCQLALATDLPIAHERVKFRLPGATLGLPCSSPAAVVARRVGRARGWRMVALGEDWGAEELEDVVRVVKREEHEEGDREEGLVRALDREVGRTVDRLLAMSPQQSAMGKWAFWTQVGITGREDRGGGSDGLEDALAWTGRVMALHAKSEDAQEGISAFLEKRPAVWKSVAENQQ